MDIYDTLLFIGGKGSGVTQIASEVGRVRRSLHINFDVLKNLPSLEELQKQKGVENFDQEKVERLIEMRMQCPHLKNLSELGYSAEVKKKIEEQIGGEEGVKVAQMYEKQFVVALIDAVAQSLKTGFVIEISGTDAMINEEDYVSVRDLLINKHSEIFTEYFPNIELLSKDKIKSIIKQFSDVTYVKLPEKEEDWPENAKKSVISNREIAVSGQYDDVSNRYIETASIMKDGAINEDQVRLQVSMGMYNLLNMSMTYHFKIMSKEEREEALRYSKKTTFFGKIKGFFSNLFGKKNKDIEIEAAEQYDVSPIIERVDGKEIEGEREIVLQTTEEKAVAGISRENSSTSLVTENGKEAEPGE